MWKEGTNLKFLIRHFIEGTLKHTKEGINSGIKMWRILKWSKYCWVMDLICAVLTPVITKERTFYLDSRLDNKFKPTDSRVISTQQCKNVSRRPLQQPTTDAHQSIEKSILHLHCRIDIFSNSNGLVLAFFFICFCFGLLKQMKTQSWGYFGPFSPKSLQG